MKLLFISILILQGIISIAQVPCFPKPEPGAVISVNVNASKSIDLNCIAMLNNEDDKKTAQNSAYFSTWRLNGKEIQPGQKTELGSIRLAGNKLLLYQAPAKKPSKSEITLTAEITQHQKKIFFWTIRIKDEAETEVFVEEEKSPWKVNPQMKRAGPSPNLDAYQARLSPEAKAKLNKVKSEHPEYLNMGANLSSAQATFFNEAGKKHFVITIADPSNTNNGLAFDLPDTLLKTYETNGEKCKAAISYGVTECKIRVDARGYVHESPDGEGKMVEGLLTITLTELGQPGQYVKGSFLGTMATYSKFCKETSTGMHYHPIELREVYGSFVAVRQVNIVKD